MRRRLRVFDRVLLPAALILIGLLTLAGCLYIPTFSALRKGQKDASKQVGPRDSLKPLRVGVATRDDVVRVLGSTPFVNGDATRMAYRWGVINGVWIMPFCATIQTMHGDRALVLTFDRTGVLESFDVLKDDEGLTLYQVVMPPNALPPDLQPRYQNRFRPGGQ